MGGLATVHPEVNALKRRALFEPLQDRRLATLAASGTALNLDLNVGSQTVSVASAPTRTMTVPGKGLNGTVAEARQRG